MLYLIPVILFYMTLGLFLLFYIKPKFAKCRWLAVFYICLLLVLIMVFIWGILRNFAPPDWAK